MDLHMVGVRIAALIVVVRDDHLRPSASNDGNQSADRLVEIGLMEASRILIGRRVDHSRTAVADHHDFVETDDFGRTRQLDRSQSGHDRFLIGRFDAVERTTWFA